MERIFQRSFKLGHYHTTGHTRGTSGGENTTTAPEVFLAVKTLKAGKAAGCNEICPEILKG